MHPAERERRIRPRHGGRPETRSRGYDGGTVLAVMDGTPERRTGETRTPLPPRPGQPAAYGSGHGRSGAPDLFMVHPPLEAWRHVKVTDRRRRRDFARLPADIADVHFPDRRTVPVMDGPTPTGCRRSTRPSGRRRRRGPRTASRSTTRRGTAAGRTWRRPGQTPSPGSAPPGASRTGRRWCGRPAPGRRTATRRRSRSTGGSGPGTPA